MAVHTECLVVPVAVKYSKIDGKEVCEANKNLVYWYGDMDFLPHFFKVLGLNKIELEIKFCKPLDMMMLEDKPLSLRRKYLSSISHQVIESNLG